MKNLVLLGENRHSVASEALPDGSNTDGERYVVDMCHVFDEFGDGGSSRVILTNDGLVVRISESDSVVWIRNLNEIKPGGRWFNIAYADPELVCLSQLGSIVTVSPSTGQAELVGVFDDGLEAGAWSPDCEVLLIVTTVRVDENESNSVLLTMNTQFEVLSEVTIDNYIPSSICESSEISVAWRPDGSLCAVSSVDASDSTRKVRIYKRETLELHAVGRTEDASGTIVKGLQHGCLAWAGSGCSQLLASVQRKGKKTLQVVFFESNGLRHREFILNEAATTSIRSLSWNVDSDLLAVTLREEGGPDKVQLWHRSNYHWYLKQEFRYPGLVSQRTVFDQESSSRFYVLLRDFCWREYEVRWDPSSTQTIASICSAYVIDGCDLNSTVLDKSMVPPPFYTCSYHADLPINHLAIYHERSVISVAMGLSDGNLVLLDPQSASLVKVSWDYTNDIDPMSMRSFLIVGVQESVVLLVAISCATKHREYERLIEVSVTLQGETATSSVTNVVDIVDSPALRIVNWSDSSRGALLILQDGTLLEYENGGELMPSHAEPLLEPLPWMVALHSISQFEAGEQTSRHHHSARLVVGMTAKGRLYCGDMLLADAASSFFLSVEHQFLVYVTSGSRCQIRFLPLVDLYNFDPLIGSDQNEKLVGYEPRSVERGARLVAILPSQPTAVLQMPRGNIEGIYPRALVLQYVMTRIIACKYGEAFLIMRRQKVDLNLLVDIDPWNFLREGIRILVEQVKNIDHLNLFISSLQDVDITQFRYQVPEWLRSRIAPTKSQLAFDYSSKVNVVCRETRSTMLKAEREGYTEGGRKVEEGHFLLPVLSTFAKENPPQLKEALALVKENALRNHPPVSKKPPLFSEKAQASIHYLAFLAEYQLLFDSALGMYDYDLARAVARNSQMDPKIYLPLLKRLRSMPTYYGRYEVDIRLANYSSALENLFRSCSEQEALEDGEQNSTDPSTTSSLKNSFEDCMLLMEERNLHRLGLKLFRSDPERHRTIMLALGEHLLSSNGARAALSVFCAAEPPDREGAKRSALACGDWRCYFTLLEDAEHGDADTESINEDRRRCAREVADDISAAVATTGPCEARSHAYAEASRILLDYAKDIDGAVDFLLGGHMWSEARRLASLYARPDLGEKCVEGASAFARNTMEELAERTMTFEEANVRYAEVIDLRKQASVVLGAPATEADDAASLFSAASNASNMSLRSTTSTSSVGSSVSSVISIKSTSTFTMTGDDALNRHRSKFNKGRRQKKPKKQRKRAKIRPGSEEELQSLVSAMKEACVSLEHRQVISQTSHFLLVSGSAALARDLSTATVRCAMRSMHRSITELRQQRKKSWRQNANQGRKEANAKTLIFSTNSPSRRKWIPCHALHWKIL